MTSMYSAIVPRLGLALLLLSPPSNVHAAPRSRADAIVVVNSASPAYGDFAKLVQPYLDNFGVPYAMLDLGTTHVPSDLGDYALIVVGHRQLDTTGRRLDAGAQSAIVAAVNAGSGLLNLDNDLWVQGAPRYPFVRDVFGFAPSAVRSGSGVVFATPDRGTGVHYVTAAHPSGEAVATGRMRLAGISLPPSARALAQSGGEPFVIVAEHGKGRAVQWASYDWMSHDVLGPMRGLDDLVWRSLAWAARKPFVMQVLPPIVTMRVDDAAGPFGWVHTANEVGLKPWIGLFVDQIDETEAAELESLVQSGGATAAVHAFDTDRFFYFDHFERLVLGTGFDRFPSPPFLGHRAASCVFALALMLPGAVAWWRSGAGGRWGRSATAGVLFGLAAVIEPKLTVTGATTLGLVAALAWRAGRRFRPSATLIAAAVGLATFGIWSFGLRGILFRGGDWPDDTVDANYARATQWHRAHDIPVSKFVVPHYYEFGSNVFSGLASWGVEYVGTQLVPGTGYGSPWVQGGPYRKSEAGLSSTRVAPSYYADFLSVPGHPEFDGRFFNCVTEIRDDAGYEWYPTADIPATVGRGTRQLRRALDGRALATLFTHEPFLADIPSENWRSILHGIADDIAPYQPTYMTMDAACRYLRARHTSSIASSVFDPTDGSVETILKGRSDVPTTFSLFTLVDGQIVEQTVHVPRFDGSVQVSARTAGAAGVGGRAAVQPAAPRPVTS